MNIVKSLKGMLFAGFLLASLVGQPLAAQAQATDQFSLNFAEVKVSYATVENETGDDVIVDGRIITAEGNDTSAGSSDPEYKYIPVRR
jgi:hypothetical protein